MWECDLASPGEGILTVCGFYHFFRWLPTNLIDFCFVEPNSARKQGAFRFVAGTSYVRSIVLFTAAGRWNALAPDIRSVNHPDSSGSFGKKLNPNSPPFMVSCE